MIDRYQTKFMSNIWSDKFKIAIWKNIQSFLVEEYENLNGIPNITSKQIYDVDISSDEILEEEKKTNHELLAFLNVLNSKVNGEGKKYIHRGLTSSDLLDTAFSYQIKCSLSYIKERIDFLRFTIKNKMEEHQNTLMLGRTHGMIAEPITFGAFLASYYSEWQRHTKTIDDTIDYVSYGKLSGPVGNYSIANERIESNVLNKLNLKPEVVGTQVIPRDRYAKVFLDLALFGSSIERFATNIRLLSQSAISEVSESFGTLQQGSSAMPHKKNPIASENLCGLSRLLRSYAIASLENIPLWNERDISHSSVERVIGPDAFHLMEYSINRMISIVSNLNVNIKNMKKNIDSSNNIFYSHVLLNYLTDIGYDRDSAYRLIQIASSECLNKDIDLLDIIKEQTNYQPSIDIFLEGNKKLIEKALKK